MPTQPPSLPPNAQATRPFGLLRFFSVLGLAGTLVVTACLFVVYRHMEMEHLVEHEGRANADQTRALANSMWSRYRDFILDSPGRTREALASDPSVARLHGEIASRMAGLQIAKVKIYNLQGTTVYSSDVRQIGEDKSTNPGFRAALAGQVASNFTYRDKFDAFEGVISERSLIASYVPVRGAEPPAAVEGVVEVYSDVTALTQAQTQAQWYIAATLLGLLACLYGFLLLVVRKADRIIRRQQEERAVREREVHHQARHDALTGLPNRTDFVERLQAAIALAHRHDHACALMFIDLDRFKIVNDSLGHHAGDLLLQEVGQRIRSCLRASDQLFRMGGDEFTVILPHISSPEDGAFVARRVIEALGRPLPVHEHELTVGASIGLAVSPGDGLRAEELLKNADAAMYSAKQAGRGQYAFYRTEMNDRALQRLNLEAALKRGFRDGEFTLHYQPRLDAKTRRVIAVEALMRWNRPGHGMVPPGEFISVLEEGAMMPMVGEWVLRTACAQALRWKEMGLPPLRVSVNVSAVQFQSPHFPDTVHRVLQDTGIAPHQLELELTESMLISNTEQARSGIRALKALGVCVSIDDFGTGYSSLNYLRHFAVDYLKIDRCFVTEIENNPRDRIVASAIIELANALDMAVVAEGVETEAQAEFLSEAQCAELQGFLFSRPLSANQLTRFLGAADVAPAERPETAAA